MRTSLLIFTTCPALLVALTGLGVTWLHGPTSPHQGLANPDIDGWPALYTEIVESEDYIVPLSYFLGFSERYTKAKGEAVIDFSVGQVSVQARPRWRCASGVARAQSFAPAWHWHAAPAAA